MTDRYLRGSLPMPRRGTSDLDSADRAVAKANYRLERKSASGQWKALRGHHEIAPLLEKGTEVAGAVRVCKRDGVVVVEWLNGKAVST